MARGVRLMKDTASGRVRLGPLTCYILLTGRLKSKLIRAIPTPTTNNPSRKSPIIPIFLFVGIFKPQSIKSGTYVLLMVDHDYNATCPTNTVLLSGLRASSHSTHLGNKTIVPLTLEKAPKPHSYTLSLFPQSKSFFIPRKFDAFLPLNKSNPLKRVNSPLLVEFMSARGPRTLPHSSLAHATCPSCLRP